MYGSTEVFWDYKDEEDEKPNSTGNGFCFWAQACLINTYKLLIFYKYLISSKGRAV